MWHGVADQQRTKVWMYVVTTKNDTKQILQWGRRSLQHCSPPSKGLRMLTSCHPCSAVPLTHAPPTQTEAVLSAPLGLPPLAEEGLPCFRIAVPPFKISYNSMQETLPFFFAFSFACWITWDILFWLEYLPSSSPVSLTVTLDKVKWRIWILLGPLMTQIWKPESKLWLLLQWYPNCFEYACVDSSLPEWKKEERKKKTNTTCLICWA